MNIRIIIMEVNLMRRIDKTGTHENVTLFDPNLRLLGPARQIPDAVREAARKLDGKTLPLQEAVKRLQEATDGEVKVAHGQHYISLLLPRAVSGDSTMKAVLRVIRFR